MWKRGGRSSALDRAQALLSAKKSSKGDARSSTVDLTATSQGSSRLFKNRPAPPNPQTLLSALGELSSDSPASELRGDDDRSAGPDRYEEKLDSNKSSVRGRSRFLKVSSTNSRKQTEQVLEPRHVSSPRSCKQVLHQSRTNLTADLLVSSPPASQSIGAEQRGNRFLKEAAELRRIPPAEAPGSRDAGVRSRSRSRSGAGDPAQRLDRKSVRVMSAVNLESDEEDMRKLLGDSMDSSDYSFSEAQRPSSIKRPDKPSESPLHSFSCCSSSYIALQRSTSSLPASPSHRSSPFRFTGQARAHFSPSVLSPSPSPPLPLPSPQRPGSSLRAGGPQRSLSASSEQGEVISLEERFPPGPDSEDSHSEMSSVASEDFQINVMTVDELAPASDGFSAETPEEQTKPADFDLDPGFPNEQLNQEKEQEEEEEVLDYQSDFESDSSTSQVSEHLLGHWEEEDVPSEVSVEAEDDHSRALSDRSLSSTSRSSDRSHGSDSSSRDSRSDSSQARRRPASTRTVKDSAAQTQPDPLSDSWSAGMASLDPTVATIYMNPAQTVNRMLGAERVEAISTFDPAAFALNEMLKQQLSMTRRFMDSSLHLHSCLLRSLEPPNYRYTMLEDTIQNTHRRRRPRLTMEKALEEVLQEMRDYQCS